MTRCGPSNEGSSLQQFHACSFCVIRQTNLFMCSVHCAALVSASYGRAVFTLGLEGRARSSEFATRQSGTLQEITTAAAAYCSGTSDTACHVTNSFRLRYSMPDYRAADCRRQLRPRPSRRGTSTHTGTKPRTPTQMSHATRVTNTHSDTLNYIAATHIHSHPARLLQGMRGGGKCRAPRDTLLLVLLRRKQVEDLL